MSIRPVSCRVDEHGVLEVGGVSVSELASEYGTALYVMDGATIRANCRNYSTPLKDIYPNNIVAYAGKANLNLGLLNVLAEEEFGVDVVSGGELITALKSNIPNDRIVFHGNNKSREELELAIENSIRIVVDNMFELELIEKIANAQSKVAILMLRIKPEIEAHTHEYIKTGQIDSKFGIEKERIIPLINSLKSEKWCHLKGIHSHIGSQIFDTTPYVELADIMAGHLSDIKTQCGVELEELNLGGGIGIQYVESDNPPPVNEFLVNMLNELKAKLDEFGISHPTLLLEPGRSIVGTAGVTLYEVGTVKKIPDVKNYVFVDGGMADNPRPIMYKSEYTFKIANRIDHEGSESYTIAGKFCESGDVLAHDVTLPSPTPGDILIVFGTGAYNYSMASNYNRFCRPAMVLVENGTHRLLVRRETYEDLLQYDMS